MSENRPACYGLSDLFDATDKVSHIRARAICSECPAIQACRGNLLEAQRTAMPAYRPEGTWAGVLLKPKQPA